jgi:hypothetical protein
MRLLLLLLCSEPCSFFNFIYGDILMTKLSAKQKMLKTLAKTDGFNTFTVASARNRFGVKNVTARIHELREEGYPIYTNRKTLADGRRISFYRLGTPSKDVVAAGYRALREQNVRAFA